MHIAAHLLVRCIKRVSLPNIIADKSIVPELLMDNANPINIAKHIEDLLFNTDGRTKMIEELDKIRSMLSEKKSSFEAAKEIDKELFN